MKVILCGANGAMGKLVDQRLGDEVVARVSIDGANGVYTHFSQLPALSADVVIDFSHHSAIADVLDYCKAASLKPSAPAPLPSSAPPATRRRKKPSFTRLPRPFRYSIPAT